MRVWSFFIILLFGLIALSACNNNQLRVTRSGSNEQETYIPSTTSLVQISRAVPSQQEPGAYDIIGNGDHALGSACFKVNSSTGQAVESDDPYGASTCQCSFRYIRSDGSSEEVATDTSYRESDLIRCAMPAVSADLAVSYVWVKIVMNQAGGATNELKIPVTGSGSGSVSSTDIESYALARRFQCRDIVYVPHLLDQNIYDPIQSEDPRLTYPLNFYSRNMGLTFSLFGSMESSIAAYWNCPMIPNDSTAGLELAVYSKAADNAGSKRIYPPTGSAFDRSTFFLAKKAIGGVFNVPVNAYVLPNTISQSSASTSDPLYPPLGYGASPIVTGSETETCPDTVSIPQGYHWVKVWLFRATLPQRVFRTSRKLASLSTIACNPGTWTDGTQMVPDCKGLQPMNRTISDRWLYGNMCVRLSAFDIFGNYAKPISPCDARQGHGPGCTTMADGKTIYSAYNGYNIPPGTDVWERSGNGSNVAGACGSTSVWDPLDLCGTNPGRVPLDLSSPAEWAPITNADGSNTARYDFIFVVTPPSVMAATMRDSSRTENYPYIPFRFKSSSSCNSPDPDNPVTPGDCSSSDRIEYGIVFHDVKTNGDSPTGSTRAIFPVCAIQPD